MESKYETANTDVGLFNCNQVKNAKNTTGKFLLDNNLYDNYI